MKGGRRPGLGTHGLSGVLRLTCASAEGPDSSAPERRPVGEPRHARPAVPFTADEARAYWDSRHAEQDDLASGGHISLARSENAMLYAVRVARMLEVLGTQSDASAPLRVLDAGCGRGHFARAIASFGHRVDGIDTSVVADHVVPRERDPAGVLRGVGAS